MNAKQTVLNFSPGLTRKEVEILAAVPYDHPGFLKCTREVRSLIDKELIEEDPTANKMYRQTSSGQEVVLIYKQKGWI